MLLKSNICLLLIIVKGVNSFYIFNRALLSYGVSINTNTDVIEITSEGLQVQDKLSLDKFFIPADVVVYTAGMRPSKLVSSLDLEKDPFGRIRVSRTLQTLKYPEVFAIGDCASVNDCIAPSTAQVAMQQSEIVSANLIIRHQRALKSLPEPKSQFLEKYTYIPLGEMLTLGKTNAAVNSLGDNLKIDGPIAAAARRLVYAFRMPTQDQQVRALFSSAANVVTSELPYKK